MPFVEIPNAWSVAMQGTYTPSLHGWAMVWGVLDGGHDHDLARAIDVSQCFIDWWDDSCQSRVMTSCQLDQVHIIDLDDEIGVSYTNVNGLPIAGSHTGSPAQGQTAAIVTLLTGARGRANRGRKYFPGLPEVSVDASDGTSLDPTVAADYAGITAQLIDAVAALDDGPSLAVISKSQSLAVPVLAAFGRSYLGTQRRRVRS